MKFIEVPVAGRLTHSVDEAFKICSSALEFLAENGEEIAELVASYIKEYVTDPVKNWWNGTPEPEPKKLWWWPF